MLDARYVLENLEAVRANCAKRGMDVDLDPLPGLDAKRREAIGQLESVNQRRNQIAGAMKGKLPPEQRQPLIDEGRQLKEQAAALEAQAKAAREALNTLLAQVPNMTHPDVPEGRTDEDNVVVREVGKVPAFDFEPADHVTLGERLGLIDFETAAKVAGQKFYYLTGEAAQLQFALVQYVMGLLIDEGFLPVVTPDLARPEVLDAIGYNPRGPETQVYGVANADLCLVGTAEITLGGMFLGDTLPRDALPRKLAGYSHCFRTEAGAAGRVGRGLYRVHQFSKVEMFVVCVPEESDAMHAYLLACEERIFTGLGIPYRVVDVCTGDLGAPAYRKYDLEAWMPGRGDGGAWGEITSTSNCTDYQARRLNVRTTDADGKKCFAHMLNGTGVAVGRALIAILENNQQADGSIRVPDVLEAYVGKAVIGPRG